MSSYRYVIRIKSLPKTRGYSHPVPKEMGDLPSHFCPLYNTFAICLIHCAFEPFLGRGFADSRVEGNPYFSCLAQMKDQRCLRLVLLKEQREWSPPAPH